MQVAVHPRLVLLAIGLLHDRLPLDHPIAPVHGLIVAVELLRRLHPHPFPLLVGEEPPVEEVSQRGEQFALPQRVAGDVGEDDPRPVTRPRGEVGTKGRRLLEPEPHAGFGSVEIDGLETLRIGRSGRLGRGAEVQLHLHAAGLPDMTVVEGPILVAEPPRLRRRTPHVQLQSPGTAAGAVTTAVRPAKVAISFPESNTSR